MKKIAISGYFDPIHVGHIEYINNAKRKNQATCLFYKTRNSTDKREKIPQKFQIIISKCLVLESPISKLIIKSVLSVVRGVLCNPSYRKDGI